MPKYRFLSLRAVESGDSWERSKRGKRIEVRHTGFLQEQYHCETGKASLNQFSSITENIRAVICYQWDYCVSPSVTYFGFGSVEQGVRFTWSYSQIRIFDESVFADARQKISVYGTGLSFLHQSVFRVWSIIYAFRNLNYLLLLFAATKYSNGVLSIALSCSSTFPSRIVLYDIEGNNSTITTYSLDLEYIRTTFEIPFDRVTRGELFHSLLPTKSLSKTNWL